MVTVFLAYYVKPIYPLIKKTELNLMMPRSVFRKVETLHEVDKKVYHRFNTSDHAFNLISYEDKGELDPFGFLEKMSSVEAENIEKGLKNKSREDYALGKGAQAINLIVGAYGQDTENQLHLKWNPLFVPSHMRDSPPDRTPEQWSDSIREAAFFYGADLVGFANLDRRWVYSENIYKPIVFDDVDEPDETDDELIIPEKVDKAVVMGISMTEEMLRTSPNQPAATTTDWGYSEMAIASVSLAEFIRAMGYEAIPCMNDTALSIPLAIDAGLGQLGRNGLLITPEYGANVRLCKVLTDMPVATDSPIDFGVTKFCEKCNECAEKCPADAISFESRTFEAVCECNNPGVRKWPVDTKKCLRFWQENGTYCSTCQVVCPFTAGFRGSNCLNCDICTPSFKIDTISTCPLQMLSNLRDSYL